MMKFEVINPFNKIVMHTEHKECVPNKEQINSMLKAGYKFKLDGKYISKKELNNLLISIGEISEKDSKVRKGIVRTI